MNYFRFEFGRITSAPLVFYTKVLNSIEGIQIVKRYIESNWDSISLKERLLKGELVSLMQNHTEETWIYSIVSRLPSRVVLLEDNLWGSDEIEEMIFDF